MYEETTSEREKRYNMNHRDACEQFTKKELYAINLANLFESDGRISGDSDYEILVRRFPENKRENTLKTLEHGRKLIRIHSKAVKLSDINIHMPS